MLTSSNLKIMKTLRNIHLFAGLILFLTLSGCDEETATLAGSENSFITNVEGPATAKVGEELLIKVTLQGMNGCAVSGGFEESVNGNIRTIAGKVYYQGSVCTQAIVSVVANYSFKASIAGTYELRFLKADKSFITHTVTVQ